MTENNPRFLTYIKEFSKSKSIVAQKDKRSNKSDNAKIVEFSVTKECKEQWNLSKADTVGPYHSLHFVEIFILCRNYC